MKKIILIIAILICGFCDAQDFINKDNFSDKIAKDIVTIEFWAGWNAQNEFKELTKLKDCNTYRVDITLNMEIQSKYNVSAIPTIIIFDNGKEVYRFEAGIAFTLEASKSDVQGKIDEIQMLKF